MCIRDRGKSYQAIRAKANENHHLLLKIPDFYERLEQSYDAKFYAQEVLGEYLHLSGGTVYTSFTHEAHMTDLRPDLNLPLLWTLDFNVDPMSSLIVQTDGGMVKVLGEIVIRNGTTQEACAEFLKRYPRHDAGIIVYGDASGFQQQTTGFSDYQVVRDYFVANSALKVKYRVPKSNPSVKERINLMNAKLRSASGDIWVQVDKECKELIKDFEQVAFKADTFQIDKDRDRQRTHLSDALGYLVWQECRPLPTIGERREQLF